ncbi:hypothetical protein V6N12_005089 [Hibiscus sabdariffa]|uniref:Uncharacterized protein n=1 Tax=Hibiscus sabdariffa TaxID=183260 RepID=A0ABR2CNG2_9ROSI
MGSNYSIGIRQEDGSFLMNLSSKIPHPLLRIDLQVRWVSSLNRDIILDTFNRSITGRRDVFLSEENARNIMHSLVADFGASQEFIDTVIVPYIFRYVQNADCWPTNCVHQVIKLRVEICVVMYLDNDIGDLVDESMANSVRFKPASKSSIEALERVHWVDKEEDEDEDEQNLLLKKKGKSEVDWQDQRRFKFKSLSLPARGVVVDGMVSDDESYTDNENRGTKPNKPEFPSMKDVDHEIYYGNHKHKSHDYRKLHNKKTVAESKEAT